MSSIAKTGHPAYILRQTMEEFSELYGIKGRVTSLKPFNPINAPDAWEIKVLHLFEQGVNEVSEVTEIGGQPYLRYMQAFYTEEGCLKCHQHQGYKKGDVRGGVGVAIPLQPYIDIKQRTVKVLLISYSILWLLGCAGILFVNRFAKNQLIRQRETEADLAAEKERLELVLDGTGLGLWDWNPQSNQVIFDERWAKMLGYGLAEIEPNLDTWLAKAHPDDLPSCFQDIQAHIDGITEYYSNIHRMRHRDGSWRYILDRGRIVERDAAGQPLRFTGTHTDITKLKETENTLRDQAAELERLNEILAHQAMYDGLTQIHNRRAFDQRLHEEWERWLHQRTVCALVIMDIDFFKKYNDTCGHLDGDACLRAVAQAVQKIAAAAGGFTARYGGEEFAILLPETGIEQAVRTAEEGRKAAEQLALPHALSLCAAVVTLSAGAAAADQTGNADDCSTLIALADQALYTAKRNGRNRTEWLRSAGQPGAAA